MVTLIKVIMLILILLLVILGWKDAKGCNELYMGKDEKELLAYNAVVAWIMAVMLIIKLVRM